MSRWWTSQRPISAMFTANARLVPWIFNTLSGFVPDLFFATYSWPSHRNIPSTSKWLKMLKDVTSFVARMMSAIGGHGSQPLSCACSLSTARMALTHPLLSPALTASVERRCKYLVSHIAHITLTTKITNNSESMFQQVSCQRVSWCFQVQGRLCWLLCHCHPWGLHRKMRRGWGLPVVHPREG